MGRITMLVAVLGSFFATAVVAQAGVNGPSNIYAVPQFYSDYERLDVHFLVGENSRCVKDQYGFYKNPSCDEVESNNGDWDIRVYETAPTWHFVHSERSSGFSGHDHVELYWTSDLLAPYCLSAKPYSRRYKAVLRLFSPLDGHVLARDTETFGLRCSAR